MTVMQAKLKARKVNCPGCGQTIEYTLQNSYRPFCSERCKLMDLGDWATEKFRIPDHSPPDLDEDSDHD